MVGSEVGRSGRCSYVRSRLTLCALLWSGTQRQKRFTYNLDNSKKGKKRKTDQQSLAFLAGSCLHEDCDSCFCSRYMFGSIGPKARKKAAVCSLKSFESKSEMIMQSLSIPSFFVVFWSYVEKNVQLLPCVVINLLLALGCPPLLCRTKQHNVKGRDTVCDKGGCCALGSVFLV